MDEALRHWTNDQARRLAGGNGAAADWRPLRVEASHRRFYRLTWYPAPNTGPMTLVAMASPPERENNGQFVALAELFAGHGIGVPWLLAVDEVRGYFLMSDLGETHFEDVYLRDGPDTVLPDALETLHRLQQVQDPRIPRYTRERFEDELDIYLTWFLGGLLGMEAEPGLGETFEVLVEATQAQPVCCVHRDFHCRNLMVVANANGGLEGSGRDRARTGFASGELRSPGIAPTGVGVVDFQDALIGPATYDLASLLRDCYYRFPEADVARWRDAYLADTTLDVDRARFARDMDLTALQRQLKAVGIFIRLHLRDGRDTHLSHVVPVLERVAELAAQYPELAPLTRHVTALLPRARSRLGAMA